MDISAKKAVFDDMQKELGERLYQLTISCRINLAVDDKEAVKVIKAEMEKMQKRIDVLAKIRKEELVAKKEG